MRLLQEADELAYRCAFACKKDIVDDPDKYDTACYHVDIMLEHLLTKSGADGVDLWLSPSDQSNFRYKRATLRGQAGQGYKFGRPPKPEYLSVIREHMIDFWDAQEIHGYEADDALGIYNSGDVCLSHIDKDINMIPGTHYNYLTGELYLVQDNIGIIDIKNGKLFARGLKAFYGQLLTGDRTDNIPGIPKVGKVTACKLLKEAKTEQECFDIVKSKYDEYYQETSHLALAEIADLVWICRKFDETGSQYLVNRGLL